MFLHRNANEIDKAFLNFKETTENSYNADLEAHWSFDIKLKISQ